MNAGKAVYGILSANSGVTDIVGTRIFPEIAEQEAVTPFVVYQLLSVDPEDTHDGPSKLDEVRFEFLCYADSYNAAADLGVAVRAALDRVSGTYNGVHVESVQFNDVDVEIEYDPRRYSQVLKFTFRIKRDDVTIALGTPVTGAVLGDLSDVDVDGVTNGQLIAYNSTSGNWEAANDAGGAEELDDLSDVKIVGTPSEGDALVFQSGFFQLGQAGASTLGDLDDVNTVGAAAGSLISYNGVDGWEISAGELPSDQVYYHNRYASEAETLLDGATETVELYYTAQADGDGLHEDAQTDTAQSGYDIQRKLYYAEKAQADPDTSGDWTQFTAIADNTTFANAKAALLAYLKDRTGGTVPISLKMTWEEVAQAPAFTGLLNESYGSGAEAAYSTRRLNGNVTDCMVIRRASGTPATTTIGFDSEGNIDEAAIETFCSGTSCTVYQWLDQSGNDNTATAAASGNEPTIYTGGALVKQDGRVGVDFDGSANVLVNTTVSITDYDFSIVNVNVHPATNGVPSGLYLDTSSNTYYHHLAIGGSGTLNNRIQARVGATTGQGFTDAIEGERNLNYLNFISATSRDITVNGVESGSNNTNVAFTGPNSFSIGAMNDTSPSNYFDGIAQEVILYGATKSSADQTSIEENIGDYFTQNTPLLDTYSGAAAAYSLRLLDSTYTGALINVWNGTSYADIYPNVFGELDTVALAAHCGSNDGFIRYWYDQSSNSNTATQTTTANMPKIYDGTTGVVTENGKPAIDCTTSATSLQNTAMTIDMSDITVISVVAVDVPTDEVMYQIAQLSPLGQFSVGTGGLGSANKIGSRYRYSGSDYTSGEDAVDGQILLFNQCNSSAGENNMYLDGTAATQTYDARSGGTFSLIIGDRGDLGKDFTGNIQEFIYYESNQSANRTDIEDNINTFYSIY